MRKVPLAGAAAALVLGVTSAVAIPIASQAAGPSPAKSKTLVFHVAFSPPEFVPANNVRNPHSPYSLGDEIVFHDQLFSGSQHVGDDAGSCVIVDVSHILANCTMVIRLPGGTGVYDAAGGDGTLVEFPNQTGKLTLHVLSLVARGGGG